MLASLDLNKERIQRKANVASRYNVYQLADAGQSCASMGKVARYMWPVRLAITIINIIIIMEIIINIMGIITITAITIITITIHQLQGHHYRLRSGSDLIEYSSPIFS